MRAHTMGLGSESQVRHPPVRRTRGVREEMQCEHCGVRVMHVCSVWWCVQSPGKPILDWQAPQAGKVCVWRSGGDCSAMAEIARCTGCAQACCDLWVCRHAVAWGVGLL